jgi:hypothetical protein
MSRKRRNTGLRRHQTAYVTVLNLCSGILNRHISTKSDMFRAYLHTFFTQMASIPGHRTESDCDETTGRDVNGDDLQENDQPIVVNDDKPSDEK